MVTGKIQDLAVRVSGDGGNTWTQFDMTDANGYPNNQNTNNPQDEVINISSIVWRQRKRSCNGSILLF